MKTKMHSSSIGKRPGMPRRKRRAFAVILVMGLLSLMVLHSMSLSRRLHLLDRELSLLEKEQIQRLQTKP